MFHQNCQKRRHLCQWTFSFIFVVFKHYRENGLKIGQCRMKKKLFPWYLNWKIGPCSPREFSETGAVSHPLTAVHTDVHGSRKHGNRECINSPFPLIHRYPFLKFFLSQLMPHWGLVWTANFMNAKILPSFLSTVFSACNTMPGTK